MRLMADERIYRHDNVTIGTLATKLGDSRIPAAAADQPAARLSQLQCLPQQSPDRGSQGRARPIRAQAEVPVITIAMDAGFQSLGPFNRAFKATTGVTPTEYRRLNATAA